MNTEALKQMIRVLEEVQANEEKRKHFDLSHWLVTGLTQIAAEVLAGAPMECGTVACACGHAALDPWFQQHGFSIIRGRIGPIPSFGALRGWPAVQEFFDLGNGQAYDLFSPTSYQDDEEGDEIAGIDVTPQMVIDRINELLNGA